MFTTAEAIVFLEEYTAKYPEFLDTPHESHSADGTTATMTLRELLNTLKGNSQASPGQQSQSAALGFLTDPPPPPRIVNPFTGASVGRPGVLIPVWASMDVDPREPPTGEYITTQEMDIYGIAPDKVEFNYEMGAQEKFPWTVNGSVEGLTPGNFTVFTTHRVVGPGGTTNALTSANGAVQAD